MVYDIMLKKLDKLKRDLDAFRPFNQAILHNLEKWFEVELTYSSNAIEGNTLTRQETSLVIEKGITVGGKPLKDHIEATNHQKALHYLTTFISKSGFSKEDVLTLHGLVLKGIDDQNAGTLRTIPVRISGSPVILPNYLKVPQMLDDLIAYSQSTDDPPVLKAARVHYKFVSIHPFVDGNGRTGRLLMNLMLMQNGYPPAIITPKDRLIYLNSLQKGQMQEGEEDYYNFIYKCIHRSLKIYLNAFQNKPDTLEQDGPLLKIGELSKATKEPVPTLRYWVKMGLLNVATTTPSGYQLFDFDQVERCNQVRLLQKQRFTLDEIYKKLNVV
jgi:Fic family protein